MNRYVLFMGILAWGLITGAGAAVAQSPTKSPAKLGPPAQAAELDVRDKSQLKAAAYKKLTLFNLILNQLSYRDNSEYDKNALMNKAYLPNDDQIFENDLVLVDDDVDPSHVGANSAAQPTIDEYLKRFDLGYAKVNDPKTIVFTPLRVQPLQNGSQVFVKLFFKSVFKGRHKTSQEPYQPTERVMEMRAERVGNDWQVRVVRLGFTLPGEDIKLLSQANPPVPDQGRPTVPANLSINSPEVPFRQPENETTVTTKFNRYWLQVVQSGRVDVPVGFYERRNEAYFYDDQTSIEFRDNSNQFLFKKGRDYQGFVRVVPIVSSSRPASDPVRPTPQSLPQYIAATPKPVAEKVAASPPVPKPSLPQTPARPDTTKQAVAVVAKPVITLTPKPVNENPLAPPVTLVSTPATTPVKLPNSLPKPDTGRTLSALSLPLKVSNPEPTPAKPAVPVYEKKPPVKPDLTTTLTADAKRQKARLRTLGAMQVVAGLAGLAGSYVGYSGIKKDYDAYTAKVDELNAEYTAWHDLARQPTGGPLSPMSITSYGKPGIYGAYAGAGISVLAVVNGIKSLRKAGKIKPKPAK